MPFLFTKQSSARGGLARAQPARRWLACWLAVLCLASLAPGISRWVAHARAAAQAPAWVEVCTSAGMAWARSDTGESGWEALVHSLDACDLCAVAIDRGTPPPAPVVTGLAEPWPHALPLRQGWAPALAPPWVHGARGPPAIA